MGEKTGKLHDRALSGVFLDFSTTGSMPPHSITTTRTRIRLAEQAQMHGNSECVERLSPDNRIMS